MDQTEIRKVAFVGIGIMGLPMAGHLMDAGYELTVYNRTAAKCRPLVSRGARLAATPAEAARDADLVITMVGTPEDVEELYLGAGGLLANSRPGAYLVDMTTSSPELAREIHDAAEVDGRHAFDAPVTGGEDGAKAATLTIFCGAADEEVGPVLPLLRVLGARVLTFGGAGKGQLAKLANQVALAGCMLGMVEGLTFAREGGLDVQKLYEALLTGTAESAVLHSLGPKVLRGDYAPGFMVRHYVKDLDLALTVAEDEDVTLPAVETAAQLYGLLSEIGGAAMGTQALSLVYDSEPACARAGLDWSVLDLPDEDERAEDDEAGSHARGRGSEEDDEDDDDEAGGVDLDEFEAPFSRN